MNVNYNTQKYCLLSKQNAFNEKQIFNVTSWQQKIAHPRKDALLRFKESLRDYFPSLSFL